MDWVEWVLWTLVGLLFALMVACMFGDHSDPCNTPENKLTADYLVCKRKIDQENADMAAATVAITVAAMPSTY